MNKNQITGWMLKGLLMVAASASVFATPILTFEGNTFNIAGGGQFAAQLSSNPSQVLQVYCIDFNNYVNPSSAYPVNVSTAGNLSNTRYGTTAESAFTYQTAPNGASLGTAGQRYSEAAWLVSQYDLAHGANGGAKDIGIQNAIWDLLDTTGAHNTQGDWQTWLNNAAKSGGLGGFTVYTTSNVANATGAARYTTGAQEMISIGGVYCPPPPTATPEPQSAALLGIGGLMIGLGLVRRRNDAKNS